MTGARIPLPAPGMRWLFDGLAARDPRTPALVGTRDRWTSRQLADAVEDPARAVWPPLGACPAGAPVRLAAPRSRPDAVIALLALWRLGLVPLLAETGGAWIQDGHTVEPPALRPASTPATEAGAAPHTGPVIDVAGRPWTLDGAPVTLPVPCDRPAYVIGTSGTTGPPAPILNHADGLARTVTALADRYRLDEASRAVLFASFGYDAALADLLPALLAGGAVLCRDDGSWQRPTAFATGLRASGATHLVLPPSVLRRVLPALEAAEVRLDVLVSAGEQLDAPLARRMAAVARHVVNAYGPSEAAICVTTFDLPRDPGPADTAVPVGRPLPGAAVRVLDERGEPVAPGKTGRVTVSGPGVAHGYLTPVGGPARAGGFRPAGPSDRPCPPQLLDTGDLGTVTGTGDLLLTGRSDDETKLHGRRIRRTDVEAALRALPDVVDAAVAVHRDRLCCLWVPAEPGAVRPAADRLAALPAPVPAVWHAVPALPTTGSDKIDREAVRVRISAAAAADDPPDTAPAPADAGYRAPAAVVERLWRRHLGLAAGAATADDFFVAGGDSLRAMDLLDDIEKETGRCIDIADFLRTPTVRHLLSLLNDLPASEE